MRLLVCVKQVLDPTATPRIAADGRSLEVGPDALFRLNRYDEFAVEEALRIKDAHPETTIDIVSVGPTRAIEAVRRAMGMGADRGFLLLADSEPPYDAFAVAGWLAAFAKTAPYDLIFCGLVSEDEMQGVVGPALAAALSLPCVTAVVAQQLTLDGGAIEVERECGAGLRERLAAPLPAVLTVQSGINRPRYPSLSHLLRAHQTSVETVSVSHDDRPLPRQTTVRLAVPQPARTGIMLNGTRAENAARLLALMREKAVR